MTQMTIERASQIPTVQRQTEQVERKGLGYGLLTSA